MLKGPELLGWCPEDQHLYFSFTTTYVNRFTLLQVEPEFNYVTNLVTMKGSPSQQGVFGARGCLGGSGSKSLSSRFLSTFVSVQFSTVTQSCPTLCDLMDCNTPGFTVHHQLLDPTQTHVHCIGDAIQPFHPLSSPSPPAFHLSKHQGLFK